MKIETTKLPLNSSKGYICFYSLIFFADGPVTNAKQTRRSADIRK